MLRSPGQGHPGMPPVPRVTVPLPTWILGLSRIRGFWCEHACSWRHKHSALAFSCPLGSGPGPTHLAARGDRRPQTLSPTAGGLGPEGVQSLTSLVLITYFYCLEIQLSRWSKLLDFYWVIPSPLRSLLSKCTVPGLGGLPPVGSCGPVSLWSPRPPHPCLPHSTVPLPCCPLGAVFSCHERRP